MSRRLPWVKWSYADWLNEHALLLCPYAARGLWADLLALMYHSPEPGYLLIAGAAMTPDQVAKLRGGTADEVTALLGELERAGVFSRDRRGVIYSRRMVRDLGDREAVRRRVARFRERGASSNATRNAVVTPTVTPLSRGEAEAETEADTEKKQNKDNGADAPGVEIPASLDTPEFRKACTQFHNHRKELRKPLRPTGERALLTKLTGWGVQKAVAALNASVANGWVGVFEPREEIHYGKRTRPTTAADHAGGF